MRQLCTVYTLQDYKKDEVVLVEEKPTEYKKDDKVGVKDMRDHLAATAALPRATWCKRWTMCSAVQLVHAGMPLLA